MCYLIAAIMPACCNWITSVNYRDSLALSNMAASIVEYRGSKDDLIFV